MTTKQFNTLTDELYAVKEKLDIKLSVLLFQSPDFTQTVLNEVHLMGIEFFSKFEKYIVGLSSRNASLSKAQLQDVLIRIENTLEYSIEYWTVIKQASKKSWGTSFEPQDNFLKTSQALLKTYRLSKALEIEQKFISNNIPIEGFRTEKKYTFRTFIIDWVSLMTGAIFVVGSGIMVFTIDSTSEGTSEMEYFFTKILIALGVAFVFTGLAKNMIQAKINLSGVAITAMGAMAVFLVLYFLSPA